MTTYYRGVEVSADVKSKSKKASDLNYRGTKHDANIVKKSSKTPGIYRGVETAAQHKVMN